MTLVTCEATVRAMAEVAARSGAVVIKVKDGASVRMSARDALRLADAITEGEAVTVASCPECSLRLDGKRASLECAEVGIMFPDRKALRDALRDAALLASSDARAGIQRWVESLGRR